MGENGVLAGPNCCLQWGGEEDNQAT